VIDSFHLRFTPKTYYWGPVLPHHISRFGLEPVKKLLANLARSFFYFIRMGVLQRFLQVVSKGISLPIDQLFICDINNVAGEVLLLFRLYT
jgi:hypothetical protein